MFLVVVESYSKQTNRICEALAYHLGTFYSTKDAKKFKQFKNCPI